MRRHRLLLVAAACSACSGSLGTVGILGQTTEPVGVKLLRPAVTGRACRTSWIGLVGEGGEPTIADATRSIYALDPEGDVLTEATVRHTAIVTGIYNRRCLEVEANLARIIRTVVIPSPSGHGGHH